MSKSKNDKDSTNAQLAYDRMLCGVNSNVQKQQSENWKDCPKCKLEMTYGRLITNEWFCLICNHKGNS